MDYGWVSLNKEGVETALCDSLVTGKGPDRDKGTSQGGEQGNRTKTDSTHLDLHLYMIIYTSILRGGPPTLPMAMGAKYRITSRIFALMPELKIKSHQEQVLDIHLHVSHPYIRHL